MQIRTILKTAICGGLSIGLVRWTLNSDALGQTPATQPSTQPTSVDTVAPDSPIARGFDQLADPDPDIREQAKVDLMGVSMDDLRKLRQLVIDRQPLAPAQSAALHEVVLQVYLAAKTYTAAGGGETNALGHTGPYFLGITWPGSLEEEDPRLGVAVDERLPGFPSFRYLRSGDMILGVYLDPTVPLQQPPNMLTQTRNALINTIKLYPLKQQVLLQVLRNGRELKIPITLAPRPSESDTVAAQTIIAFNQGRIGEAEDYWHERFAPLLENSIAASNSVEGP